MNVILASLIRHNKNEGDDESNIIPFPQPEDDRDPNGPACLMAA